MAVMQFCRKPPACTQRMAVHMRATKARGVRGAGERGRGSTSDYDGGVGPDHAEGGADEDGVGDVVFCAHLGGGG